MRPARLSLLLLTLHAATARAQSDSDPFFAPDKALHFSVSFGLAGAGYTLGALAFDDRSARLHTGALFAFGIGVAKELWDVSHSGSPSFKDLAWDATGIALGLIVCWCVDKLLFDQFRTIY